MWAEREGEWEKGGRETDRQTESGRGRESGREGGMQKETETETESETYGAVQSQAINWTDLILNDCNADSFLSGNISGERGDNCA